MGQGPQAVPVPAAVPPRLGNGHNGDDKLEEVVVQVAAACEKGEHGRVVDEHAHHDVTHIKKKQIAMTLTVRRNFITEFTIFIILHLQNCHYFANILKLFCSIFAIFVEDCQ